jgi:hypothetical protein
VALRKKEALSPPPRGVTLLGRFAMTQPKERNSLLALAIFMSSGIKKSKINFPA